MYACMYACMVICTGTGPNVPCLGFIVTQCLYKNMETNLLERASLLQPMKKALKGKLKGKLQSVRKTEEGGGAVNRSGAKEGRGMLHVHTPAIV